MVCLVTGGIDEAPQGSKKASGSAHGAKRETVNCCEQANALIHRIAEGWSERRTEVGVQDAADVRTSGA